MNDVKNVKPVKRNGKPIPWDQDVEILARLAVVASMLNQRAKPYQIAQALGYNVRTAHRDIDRVLTLWKRESLGAVADERAASVAQYKEIQLRAWEEFRNTRDSKVRLNALKTAMDAQSHIDELTGTKQRVGIDITSNGKTVFSASELNDEELAEIAAGKL